MRHQVTEDLLRWVDREEITVLLVTHDLEEAITLSDRVHLLPRGRTRGSTRVYEVPLDRPRDLVVARTEPEFGPLLRRMWDDLTAVSSETVASGARRRCRGRDLGTIPAGRPATAAGREALPSGEPASQAGRRAGYRAARSLLMAWEIMGGTSYALIRILVA